MSTPHENAELVAAIADAIDGADRSADTLDWTPEARAALAAISDAGLVLIDRGRVERLIHAAYGNTSPGILQTGDRDPL